MIIIIHVPCGQKYATEHTIKGSRVDLLSAQNPQTGDITN